MTPDAAPEATSEVATEGAALPPGHTRTLDQWLAEAQGRGGSKSNPRPIIRKRGRRR